MGFFNLDLSNYADTANEKQCTDSYIWLNAACYKRNESQCNRTENYYWNGQICVYRPPSGKITCSPSYKINGGYCDHIRYTPDEAAKVLHDDNTNIMTLMFKK